MTPKIEQLLLQVAPRAGEDGEYLPSLHTPEDIEQFARLIVRECARAAGDFEYARLHDSLVEDHVLKHFGVTE